MEFAFARSANMLEEEESSFESWFLRAFDTLANNFWTNQERPIFRKAAAWIPSSVIKLAGKEIASFFDVIKVRHTPIHIMQTSSVPCGIPLTDLAHRREILVRGKLPEPL
jgi:hypothetical protein